ncbi:hypothetical protein WJX72_011639 [[Myrmecia] bisecta]|uniref:MYB transcription factor n=1 Tax=[Myrmecia] bisecta TaxID=41462 RepID=A0AAW1QGR8_9CHLO
MHAASCSAGGTDVTNIQVRGSSGLLIVHDVAVDSSRGSRSPVPETPAVGTRLVAVVQGFGHDTQPLVEAGGPCWGSCSSMSAHKRPTGAPKQKWTEEEERALRRGVAKYGVGKWRLIQKDEQIGEILENRSNVDLKDKWRNLNMDSYTARTTDANGSAPSQREGSARRKRKKKGVPIPMVTDDEDDDHSPDYAERAGPSGGSPPEGSAPKRARHSRKPAHPTPAAAPSSGGGPPVPLFSARPDAGLIPDDMVVAAIISLQEPGGSDADAISDWIEGSYSVGATFRKTVKGTLRRMVESGRLALAAGPPPLYRLAGVVRKLTEDDALEWPPDKEPPDVDDLTAKEAAAAAARAVREAEEAADLATQLMAAADQYEREALAAGPNNAV